jgi:hypothetical protein
MMRIATGLMVVLAAAFCLSCSSVGYLHVLNASGAPITLRLKPHYFDPTSVTLRPDGWAKILRFRIPDEGPALLAGGCVYTYELPSVPRDHPVRRGPDDLVQVNPDLSVMLLPPRTRAAMPVAALEKIQPPGFPVRPASADCRQP